MPSSDRAPPPAAASAREETTGSKPTKPPAQAWRASSPSAYCGLKRLTSMRAPAGKSRGSTMLWLSATPIECAGSARASCRITGLSSSATSTTDVTRTCARAACACRRPAAVTCWRGAATCLPSREDATCASTCGREAAAAAAGGGASSRTTCSAVAEALGSLERRNSAASTMRPSWMQRSRKSSLTTGRSALAAAASTALPL
mmetsp:Transcript_20165/g.77194  ORF Transcript_20165/g.77194 Transcript_20165/m.77194 type:complete len:203 (+) Transcript_20165:1636-2244(+)